MESGFRCLPARAHILVPFLTDLRAGCGRAGANGSGDEGRHYLTDRSPGGSHDGPVRHENHVNEQPGEAHGNRQGGRAMGDADGTRSRRGRREAVERDERRRRVTEDHDRNDYYENRASKGDSHRSIPDGGRRAYGAGSGDGRNGKDKLLEYVSAGGGVVQRLLDEGPRRLPREQRRDGRRQEDLGGRR